MKKILISCAIALLPLFPASASNMGYYYPSFSGYLSSYDPTAEEIGRYIDEYEEYVRGCREDIETILRAKEQADSEVEMALQQYKMSHMY